MPRDKNPAMQFPGHMESVMSEVGSGLRKRNVSIFKVMERAAKPEGIQTIEEIVDALAKLAITFKYDKRKDGWRLLEDVSQTLTAAGFDLVPFLDGGEDYAKGDAIAARAVELGASLGQHDAEWLEENQHLISTEYRGKYYLVFPGTKWRDSGGDVCVPCLGWLGDRWVLVFSFLGHGFGSDDRLVRPRK